MRIATSAAPTRTEVGVAAGGAKRRQRGRAVNGILLLDKPQGISSNRALQTARRLFDARKAGHTGSLDPLATGMLPLCFGEATKMSGYLLEADKEYLVRGRLGQRSDSGDADGEIVEQRPVPAFDEAVLEAVLARFRGVLDQVPPMYSALKRDGQPLYKLARQGIEVAREPRRVRIDLLECTARDAQSLSLRVRCSKGTYIRSLVQDIGEALGCGALVSELRRSYVAPFRDARMVTLDGLRELAEAGDATALDARLLPVDAALIDWPAVSISAPLAQIIRQGQPIRLREAPDAQYLRLYGEDGGFVGLGRVLEDGRIAAKRLMAVADN